MMIGDPYWLKVVDEGGNLEVDETVSEREVERALAVILKRFLDDVLAYRNDE